MNIPEQLKYSEKHQWVSDQGDGTVLVGITDFAQEQLGDIVFIDLPEVGKTVNSEEVLARIESVKSVSDVYIPVSGEVLEINQQLSDAPESMNTDPYGAGWIAKIKIQDPTQLETLLSATDYEGTLSS